jgi:hypothetical protein
MGGLVLRWEDYRMIFRNTYQKQRTVVITLFTWSPNYKYPAWQQPSVGGLKLSADKRVILQYLLVFSFAHFLPKKDKKNFQIPARYK